MKFFHHDTIWAAHGPLAAGALWVTGITPDADMGETIAVHHAVARERLARGAEGEFAEIQAWRRVFSAMGLRPTQYRCAAESLLRRFRKEGALPPLHPLVDVCNAVSLSCATPVAVFDLARISGDLVVRPAQGNEIYECFGGEQEQPEPGEVIFADDSGQAHARRWCHRQSACSAVRDNTVNALIVAEAMHGSAAADIGHLMGTLASAFTHAGWSVQGYRQLTRQAPCFEPESPD
ncbi:MAG: phenylalanine--tRNA ligase beta subunit-related protein [Variovorax sp.]